jgi:CDP-glycerol glycerophosphotransferase
MPALSFVLVVHREQAHIEQCVSSLLGQPTGDVELLAIDDASPTTGRGCWTSSPSSTQACA